MVMKMSKAPQQEHVMTGFGQRNFRTTVEIHSAVLLLAFLISTVGHAALIESQPHGDGYNAEKQAALDQRRVWRFDDDKPGQSPDGFSAHTLGEARGGTWRVAADPIAPSRPHVLVQAAPCPGEACFQLLLADGVTYDYLDLTLKLRPTAGQKAGTGGVVLGAKDARNFYAVVVEFSEGTLSILRVVDGRETVLGRAPITRKRVPWHHVRVQRNTIISKEYIEAYFDGKLTISAEDRSLGPGQIGLVTRGEAPVEFDNVHAIRMYSQRPLSGPAAY